MDIPVDIDILLSKNSPVFGIVSNNYNCNNNIIEFIIIIIIGIYIYLYIDSK